MMTGMVAYGPWNDEFVVVKPGEAIRYEHFPKKRRVIDQHSREIEIA